MERARCSILVGFTREHAHARRRKGRRVGRHQRTIRHLVGHRFGAGFAHRHTIGVDKCAVWIVREHGELRIIRILDSRGTDIPIDVTVLIIKVFLERAQIVFGNAAGHRSGALDGGIIRINRVALMLLALIVRTLLAGSHHAGQVEGLFVDADRVSSHRLALNIVDISVHACRNGHDQCDADDADGSCECRKERTALLGA